MKLPVIFLTCALFLVAAGAVFAAGEYSNRRAPGFSLSDSHFQQHDTQDYRGKVLIVDFIQTTCAVCQKLTDVLLRVKASYGDKIGIMSITTLPDNYGTVDKFVAERKISWPVLFDAGQVMASYLKITPANPKVEFPHMFIIDKVGTIRYDYNGYDDSHLTTTSISEDIDKLLK
jgi:peroxiredoxin